jgi:hypothetical protein
VTTKTFLAVLGLASLRDLPDLEKLEDAGLLSKDTLLARRFRRAAPTFSPFDDPDPSGGTEPRL